jgi:hypothetical protein
VNPAHAVIDLDDTEALIDSDRDALLRAASTAGAQVRATGAATEEGALDSIRDHGPPRTLIWVAGRGTAEAAGAMLAAALGGTAAEPIVVAAEVPPWIGPLDVLVVAGDDPGDPALVTAAATGVHRGVGVVVAAPYEGPLRDVTAGRVAVLQPRLGIPDEFGLPRFLAVGLAVLASVDAGLRIDLAALADELDAEALRNSAGREMFANAAKTLAGRVVGRRVVLAGDGAATLALGRHASMALLRIAGVVTAASGLADALVAVQAQHGSVDDIFHDDDIDGPSAGRLRVLVLSLAGEREMVAARIGRNADIDLIGAQDVPMAPEVPEMPSGVSRGVGRIEELAMLAVRLEMAAVYLRLVQG